MTSNHFIKGDERMGKIAFGSEAWIQAFKNELNSSKEYEEAGKTWEGDFYFVVEPEGPVTETIYMYVDLYHGKAREACIVKDKSEKNPAYLMTATYGKWQKVVAGQLDPIQGMLTGQLKLKGNMVQVMKYVKAAQEIVKTCARIDTEFTA
jgi:putative sterol carrier protein